MGTARTALGAALVTSGLLALGYAATTYVRGAVERDRVRTAWEQAQARAAVRDVEASARGMSGAPASLARGAPVAQLLIPRLRLDEIVVEGVGNRELNAGPGHVPGSVLPGEAGNSVISAHRDRHFRPLSGLAVGDTIETRTAGGTSVRWVVRSRRILDKDAPALFAAKTPTLTLTTCWPIAYLGSAPDRLIVTAEPVGKLYAVGDR